MAEERGGSIKVNGSGFKVAEGVDRRRATDFSAGKSSAVLAGLQAAGFKIGATIVAVPEAPRRRTEADTIEVPVAPGEASALLLEDADGVLGWRFPDQGLSLTNRRSRAAVDVYLVDESPEITSGTPRRRNAFTDWAIETVTKPIRIYAVRFLARKSISAAVAHIESAVVPGPVLIEPGADAASWRAVDIARVAEKLVTLRKRKPPRMLLLVHGTFSSTLGSFGALMGDQLLAQYDLVLGYDHRTLAEDPVANAEAILAALHALDLPETVVIDALAYSRGGLVYRVLTERLVPKSPLRATFGKAVFVGCTNAGTLLAEPDNWKALLDVYTNVLVVAARTGLGLAGAGAVEPLVTAALRTMGSFAQMLSQVAITERRVPGLAAMEPDGPLVTQLNSTVRTAEQATRYFVVATDFNVAASSTSLAGRAALAVLNRVTDRLYDQVANDMVVPTASMSAFGTAGQAEDIALIPDADGIYHTIYFTSDNVRKRIARWLAPEQPVGASAPEAAPAVKWMDGSDAVFPIPDPDSLRIGLDRGDSRTTRSAPRGIGFRQGNAGINFGDIDTGALPGVRAGPPGGTSPRDFEIGHSEALETAPAPPSGKPRKMQPVADAPEPAPLAPGATTERFIAAEMNPFPVLERSANIYVTVSPDPITVADHAAAAQLEEAVTLARQDMLTIEVVPMLNCEVVGENEQAVSLGLDDEEVLKFRVRGLTAGSGEVLIVARQGSRSVATFTLKPVFVDAAPAPLRASASLAPAAGIIKGRVVLRIYEFKTASTGVRLQFNLTSDDPAVAELAPLEINGAFSLEGYTSEVIRQVENAWNLAQSGPNQEIYSSFLRRMRSDAKVRTDGLIPDVIRRRLWASRQDISEIQVISSEPLIPWELMYLSDPDDSSQPGACFFAELALTRWLHDAPLNRHRIRPDRGNCFHVIPKYSRPGEVLVGAEAEADMLKKLGLVMTIPPHSSKVVEFLSGDAAKSCAVLHFACHGRTQQSVTVTSELLMEGQVNAQGTEFPDPLTWQDVYANADFGTAGGPLVFVNACQTGQQGSGIAGPAGFASAFLRPASRRGAAAFIGALWSVDDKLAGDFASAVYDGLTANLTLAKAVAAARNACKSNNDFTWLAYSVYANG